jgi:2-polyprenyl-3-methyl-5-hydroxy-6-metoxy-1,4-benzoquinol methylase
MLRRNFIPISVKNKSNSGLTELNATDALNAGFMSHNDWVGHGARYGFIAKWIAKNHPKLITDVGCGRFSLLNWLWRNRSADEFDYVGLDLRASVKWFDHLGWKKGNVTLVRIDLALDTENFDLAKADLTVCTEVFEHVPRSQQQNLLNDLYRWTKPGGTCIFSTPNAGVSKSTADHHIGPEGSRERAYEEKISMVRKAGFDVIKAYGVFIAKSRVPENFWMDPKHLAIFEFLPNSMATVFAAAPYPAESNNSLFIMRRK